MKSHPFWAIQFLSIPQWVSWFVVDCGGSFFNRLSLGVGRGLMTWMVLTGLDNGKLKNILKFP